MNLFKGPYPLAQRPSKWISFQERAKHPRFQQYSDGEVLDKWTILAIYFVECLLRSSSYIRNQLDDSHCHHHSICRHSHIHLYQLISIQQILQVELELVQMNRLQKAFPNSILLLVISKKEVIEL